MWIKLLGICLVCVSCAGIGGGEALRLIGRRRFLEEVKRIAAGLRGEIGYTQAVLPLVLCRAGARGDGKAGKLFLVAGERLEANPECPFGRIWEAVLEEQGIRPMLGTEEWELMCRHCIWKNWNGRLSSCGGKSRRRNGCAGGLGY